jgi:hypothetical protein
VIEVRKLLDQPIIRGHMDAGLGANINSGRLTGTSNAKSTVTETPSAVVSTDQPESCSTPSRYTVTVPDTGLMMVRTSISLPDTGNA